MRLRFTLPSTSRKSSYTVGSLMSPPTVPSPLATVAVRVFRFAAALPRSANIPLASPYPFSTSTSSALSDLMPRFRSSGSHRQLDANRALSSSLAHSDSSWNVRESQPVRGADSLVPQPTHSLWVTSTMKSRKAATLRASGRVDE
jgi:hypothetical protein